MTPNISETIMAGRPWDHTMEMNGRSTASYLEHTFRFPVFLLILIGLEAKELLDSRGNVGSRRLYGGTFARSYRAHLKGVTERGVFAFACQYIVSTRPRTGNPTVTQMRHPLLVEGRPNCARQSLGRAGSDPLHVGPAGNHSCVFPCWVGVCGDAPFACDMFMVCCMSVFVLSCCPSCVAETTSGLSVGTSFWVTR